MNTTTPSATPHRPLTFLPRTEAKVRFDAPTANAPGPGKTPQVLCEIEDRRPHSTYTTQFTDAAEAERFVETLYRVQGSERRRALDIERHDNPDVGRWGDVLEPNGVLRALDVILSFGLPVELPEPWESREFEGVPSPPTHGTTDRVEWERLLMERAAQTRLDYLASLRRHEIRRMERASAAATPASEQIMPHQEASQ